MESFLGRRLTERGEEEGAETNYDDDDDAIPSPADLAQLNAITAITSLRSSLAGRLPAFHPSFLPWVF